VKSLRDFVLNSPGLLKLREIFWHDRSPCGSGVSREAGGNEIEDFQAPWQAVGLGEAMCRAAADGWTSGFAAYAAPTTFGQERAERVLL
jgi:hypothetical protein